MPICPEAFVLMLAAVRVGAVHSLVFSGFGATALAQRVRASGSRIVLAADVTYRKGRAIPLKGVVDEALANGCESVEACVVVQREPGTASMSPGRDLDWEEFLAGGAGHDGGHVAMEANEPAYILATAGTTDRPKLVVQTHGGYAVGIHAMARWCYGLRPEDVWWATSDIGWVVGHSYMVYAPLLVGCTGVAYEGALDHPDAEAVWRIVEEQAVTGLFASPTGVRLLAGYGQEPPAAHDWSSRATPTASASCRSSPARPAWRCRASSSPWWTRTAPRCRRARRASW